MAKNVTVTPADGDIQFENSSGTAAGRIEQDGDDLVISNAVGDILFGDIDSDVYIGDGVNSVDLLFEQSGSIKAEDGSTGVTLTVGSSDTTLNLYDPQIANGMTLTSTMTIGSGGSIDFTPDTGVLLKFDGQTILERTTANGGLTLGHDDAIIIAGGDTSSVMNTNITNANEAVYIGAEGGLVVYGFPNNDTSWNNRQQFSLSNDGKMYFGTASDTNIYRSAANTLKTDDSFVVGDRLYITTLDTNTSSTTALVMNGTEVEKRTLGSNAFNSTAYSTFDGAYSSLSGVPSTFAPSSHNHDGRYYTETESDQRFPRGRTISYAAAEDNGSDAWYKIFQVTDDSSTPVECHIRGYAHTSLSFVVSEGYQGGHAHINILDALSSSTNSGYKFIEGVRVASNGDVEILLNGGSNVSIEMTIIGDATPVSSLVVSTTEAVNIKDSVTTLSNGMMRTYGKLYIGDTDASTTATTALFLNGEEVESRTLGSNAFNSTSYLPLAGGTMTGNIILGANKIAADTTAPTAHIQVGAGTSNTGNRSDIALLGGSNAGGVINALGLVNTAAGANSNGVALNFHNGNSWSPTGQIIVKQNSSGTSTDSGMYFYTYDGGLNNRMTIKNDGNIRLHAYSAGLLKTDANGNVSVDTSSYLTSIGSNSVGITELNVADGSAGQVLTTDGNGSLSFTTVTSGGGEDNVQSNWNETDTSSDAFIQNKPSLFDGAYSSLSGVPSTFAPSSHNHDSRYYTESEMQHFMARALGWVSAYGNSAESYVNYDFTNDAVEISGGGDNTTGGAFKAIRVKSGDKVRFTVMLKGSSASDQGLYLRFYQHNGDLPDGKTHVSHNASSSESVVEEDDASDTTFAENRPVPSAWTTYEHTYTAAADGYVSLVVLNWSGHGNESIYVKQPDVQFEKVNDASKLGGTAASSYLTAHPSITEATTNLSNSGRTYIQSITLDSNGHVTGVSTGTETVTNTNTTYSAGSGLDLTSTTFSVEADLRDGITHVGVDTKNYITFDPTNGRIDFYAGNVFVARLESDGDLHVKGDVIAFSSIFS